MTENNQILVYFILLLSFIAGSIYNFRIRKQCIYNSILKKPTKTTLIFGAIIMFVIAYIGGNTIDNYILSLAAIIFLVSGPISGGIHKNGISYMYGRGILVRIAKWEDVKDIKLDLNKNKLESFKNKTLTVFPNQYYTLEDMHRIEEYLEN